MLLDAFMKLEEPKLEGESTDSVHAKEIEILSFEQTIQRLPEGVASSGGAGKVQSEHAPLTVIKPLDKTSPKLLQYASEGKLFKKVTISLCQPSGTVKSSSDGWKRVVYLEMTLEQVYISRFHVVGTPALHPFGRATSFPIAAPQVLEMGPVEEIDLTYKKIQWLYKGGTGTSNITGKWNLQTNKAE